jgi:two-component system OmpR family response regulator
MKTVNSRIDKPARPIQNGRATRSRILVVDDDASVREMLTRVLIGEGYLVWSLADGAGALELAAVQKIDLVLLDLNLPEKSGWHLFQRFISQNPLLTVIIITARSNQLFTALGAGVAALLEKPFNFPNLLQTIGRLLAESPESRGRRTVGRSADFQYLQAKPLEPQDRQL